MPRKKIVFGDTNGSSIPDLEPDDGPFEQENETTAHNVRLRSDISEHLNS